MTVLLRLSLMLVATVILSGCAWLEGEVLAPTEESSGRYPDVVAVELQPAGERVFDVVVTISSPYDTPERYADGWRVLDAEGNVLGTHMLMHDHANEQPFTRAQRGLEIPAGITAVTVEGRDQANGYGGATITVDVPA